MRRSCGRLEHRGAARTPASHAGHVGVPRGQGATRRPDRLRRLRERAHRTNPVPDRRPHGRPHGLGGPHGAGPAFVAGRRRHGLGHGGRALLRRRRSARRRTGLTGGAGGSAPSRSSRVRLPTRSPTSVSCLYSGAPSAPPCGPRATPAPRSHRVGSGSSRPRRATSSTGTRARGGRVGGRPRDEAIRGTLSARYLHGCGEPEGRRGVALCGVQGEEVDVAR